jgi:hypothetical protein
MADYLAQGGVLPPVLARCKIDMTFDSFHVQDPFIV